MIARRPCRLCTFGVIRPYQASASRTVIEPLLGIVLTLGLVLTVIIR